MRNHVNREMANSQRGTDLEIEAAIQSHYIELSRVIGISDPCRQNVDYQKNVAMYIKYLHSGVNNYSKNNLRFKTLCGYSMAINTLFELQKYRLQINFSNNNNLAGVIIILPRILSSFTSLDAK
jgi:hypothetical protein